MKTAKLTATLFTFVAIAPALFICSAGILYTGFGIKVANDWVNAAQSHAWSAPLISVFAVLGGPLIVLIYHGRKLLRFQARSAGDEFTLVLSLRRSLWNWVPATAGGLLLAAVLAYGFVENFKILPR